MQVVCQFLFLDVLRLTIQKEKCGLSPHKFFSDFFTSPFTSESDTRTRTNVAVIAYPADNSVAMGATDMSAIVAELDDLTGLKVSNFNLLHSLNLTFDS